MSCGMSLILNPVRGKDPVMVLIALDSIGCASRMTCGSAVSCMKCVIQKPVRVKDPVKVLIALDSIGCASRMTCDSAIC